MDKLILGVDAGNFKAKTVGIHGVDSYKTNICGWFERNVVEKFGEDDMEFLIDGRKGYAGSIAEHEDEFGNGTTYGDTKAHEDTKIRVLLAIHRYIEKYSPDTESVWIVTGQPISGHHEEEKAKIINMLRGTHKFTVNGLKRKITVEDVKVTPEGSGAFWSNPQPHTIRVLDVGSGTVNMATVTNKNHIHKSSDTMPTGIETMKNKNDFDSLSRAIIQNTLKLKWKKDDKVLVCGGVAEKITPHLQKHFLNAEVIQPQLKREFDIMSVKPTYANAVGFYNLAKLVYE